MIYEYAVDPALVASWAKNFDIGLAPQFGLDQRRLVSDFPMHWEGDVTGALLESFGYDCGDPDYIVAQAHLNGLLHYMKSSMPARGQRSTGGDWIEQALLAHTSEPFHAILTGEENSDRDEVISSNIVKRLQDPRWYLPTVGVTAKTAGGLADALEPLLRTANKIILVDPYFNPKEAAYQEVLTRLVERAIQGRAPGRALPTLTIMSGVDERAPAAAGIPVETQLRNAANHRGQLALTHLGGCIPVAMSLTFQCIAQFAGGDQVHNRYLLTDVGGACFPYGVQAMGSQVFDDLTLLYAGQYRHRWRQYAQGEGLTVVGTPVVVQGSQA